jgi:hypothetical protein
MAPHIVDTLPELSLMLAEFACRSYEYGLVAIQSRTLEIVQADMLSVVSCGTTLALTGPEPFGMEDSNEYVATRVEGLLAAGGAIVAGDARLTVDGTRPLVKAYRPNRDALLVETGGGDPACLVLMVDRERGLVV